MGIPLMILLPRVKPGRRLGAIRVKAGGKTLVKPPRSVRKAIPIPSLDKNVSGCYA